MGSVDPNFLRLECAINKLFLSKNGWPLTKKPNNKKIMAIISEYTGKVYKTNGVDEAIKDGLSMLNQLNKK